MPPSLFHSIKKRVQTAGDQLTEQQLDTQAIPESLGELIEWCKQHEFYAELQRHNDPHNPYCIRLYAAFVI